MIYVINSLPKEAQVRSYLYLFLLQSRLLVVLPNRKYI